MAWSLIANTGKSIATTNAIDTTGADLLVVGISGSSGTPTVSDSKGNTWTSLTDHASVVHNRLFYCRGGTVGTGHTFTAGGISYYAIMVQAWSGSATSPFDVENGTADDTSSLTIQPGSITPTQDGELLVAAVAFNDNSGGAVSIGSGFSISDTQPFVPGTANAGSFAYLVQTTAAAINPTWNFGNTAPYRATSIASFKGAAAGSTYSVAVAEGSATAADSPSAALVAFYFPIADIATGGWLAHDPFFGGSPDLWEMLDETVASFGDYIYSPNNPTTQQFEVKLGPLSDPLTGADHGVSIALWAGGLDTNFDFNLVQGTTVLDSWTENVTVAAGQVIRTHTFSGAVANAITDYSDLRIRGIARA